MRAMPRTCPSMRARRISNFLSGLVTCILPRGIIGSLPASARSRLVQPESLMRYAALALALSLISFGAFAAEAPPRDSGMQGMDMGTMPNPQPGASSGKHGGMANMPGMENMRGPAGMPYAGLLGTYPMTRDAS